MRKVEIELEYQGYIPASPHSMGSLYGQATANDGVTIQSWEKTWLTQIAANKKRFGDFKKHGIGQLFAKYARSPAVIAGSGPSLKVNSALLKDRDGIPLISCLHNFHHFEDQGIAPDYYVSLDAGPVVIEEVSEGGKRSAEEYWEMTKDRTLVAYIGSHPDLFAKWKGKIYLFNAPVPSESFIKQVESIERFNTLLSTGGNVLGACLYLARAMFGCNPIAFVGADFSFSYDKKFHAWDSKYDTNLGQVLKTVDVYGNKVFTWQSYANFKAWFEYIAQIVPGVYINCTEGGTFGAYPEGNIMAVRQMELADYLRMNKLHEEIRVSAERPDMETKEIKILF